MLNANKYAILQSVRRYSSAIPASIHSSQIKGLTDTLIRVDMYDNALGPIPKLDSHLSSSVKAGMIHRAFSVFLFSKKTHSLLIQKRASTKIVFPQQWANTCCSHPLFNDADMENVLGNQIGIKRAAVKRLDIELGLKGVTPSQLSFKEKILYGQLSPGGIFGESECDYILMGELINDSMFPANENEVEKVEWIPPGPKGNRTTHLIEFLDRETHLGYPPTPWFDLILRERECLETWWESLIRDTKTFMENEDVRNGEIRNFFTPWSREPVGIS